MMPEPMNGPMMVPEPPMMAISTASTDIGNEAAAGLMKRL